MAHRSHTVKPAEVSVEEIDNTCYKHLYACLSGNKIPGFSSENGILKCKNLSNRFHAAI